MGTVTSIGYKEKQYLDTLASDNNVALLDLLNHIINSVKNNPEVLDLKSIPKKRKLFFGQKRGVSR